MSSVVESDGFRLPDAIPCVCGGTAEAAGLIVGPEPRHLEEDEVDPGDHDYARYVCQSQTCGRWMLIS